MSAREKLLRLATTTPNQFVDVDVTYIKGRGYFLSVKPITVDDGIVTFLLKFDLVGHRLIETAARFSAKRLAQIADLTLTSVLLQQTLTDVLANEGLTLTPGQTECQAATAAIS